MDQSIRILKLNRFQLRKAAQLILEVYDASSFDPKERENFAKGLSLSVMGPLFWQRVLFGYAAWQEKKMIGVLILRGKDHISQLFILPEYQKKGVGRMLLKAGLETLSAERITVFAARPSVGFYEALGFEEDAEFSGEYREDTVPMVLLRK